MTHPFDPNLAPSSVDEPKPKRPLRTWIILLVIWAIGIGVWALYLILAAIILFRIL